MSMPLPQDLFLTPPRQAAPSHIHLELQAAGGPIQAGRVEKHPSDLFLRRATNPSRPNPPSSSTKLAGSGTGIGAASSVNSVSTKFPFEKNPGRCRWKARILKYLKTNAGNPREVGRVAYNIDSLTWDDTSGEHAMIREMSERHPRGGEDNNRISENSPVGRDVAADRQAVCIR